MRPTRTAAVALLGAAAIALSVPVAVAADAPVGSVDPSTAKPGEKVHLSLQNCNAWLAKADGGDAFGLVKLHQDHDKTFSGTATVSADVKPGSTHTIKFWCGHKPDGTATLTIAKEHKAGAGGDGEDRDKWGKDGGHDKGEGKEKRPSHGTEGGEGGTVGGFSTTTAVAGAGVLVAAAAGGVFLMRRRSSSES